MERKKRVPFYWTMLVFLMCLLPCFVLKADAEDTVITDSVPVCYARGDVNGDGQVDSKDAIRVLYHHFFEDNPDYAVSQDCDFDKDGKLTAQDAVYVLYGASGGELAQSHPLTGTVHQYYTPVWFWTEDAHAQVNLQCGCGQNLTLTEEDGITVRMTQKPAACVDAGAVTYEATLVYDGKTYIGTKQTQIPALGHTMEGTRDCENGSHCVVCNQYTLEALGHNWVLDPEKSTAATCSVQAVQVYKCANDGCGQEKEVTLTGYAQHAYALAGEVSEPATCQFRQILKCECGAQIEGEAYYRHVYTAALTKEATCREEGEKTFTCICGDSYTEAVPVNGSHTWGEGTTEGNITSYTCVCGETKTAVCAQGDTANVTREDLAASTEVQINNVAISLNENTISNLDETVQIQVKTTTAAALPVAESVKQQIGNNPVYDFSLTSGENIVSDLGGSATIQVPYTLQPGDDVDCIDIWFISDDGVTTCVQGTYSNGYVTFTTDHFSYYTVTRLTPAQRCEAYGHAIAISHMDATCVQEGYHKEICQRCGNVQADQTLKKTEHDYQEEETQATCTDDGSFRKTCASCQQTVSGTIPALGHNWQKDESQSAAASCEAAGKNVYICANGCGQSYTEELPQLQHEFGDIEESGGNCDTQGHKKRVCRLCGYVDMIDISAPTGHDYLAENAVWEWEEDYSRASVTLVCTYNKKHTKTLKATVTSEIQGEACLGTAKVVYTAVAKFNKYSYTDVKTVPLAQEAHQPEKSWQTDDSLHYRVCENCGKTVDSGNHVWGQQIVTQAATCSTAGSAKQSCSVCDYTKTIVLEATGEHSYVNGTCKDCGFTENSCGHIRTHKTPLDLSGYGICDGTDIQWVSCECGEVKYLYVDSLFCNTEYSHREETLATGETVFISTETCKDCGLMIENRDYCQTEKETCQTREVEVRKLFVDDELIASGERIYDDGEASGYHMANIRGETVDLSQYGDLCGVVLQTWHCSCGKISYTSHDYEESSCRWMIDESQSTDSVSVYTCRFCGAVYKNIATGSSEGENCTVIRTYKTVYEVNGQQIYSTDSQECWIQHDYEIVEAQLDGESCADGVYLKQICRDCGKVYEQYVDYHIPAKIKKTVLEGFCSDTLVEAACACGENKECYLDSSKDSYCHFDYEDDTAICQKCGLTEKLERKQGQKDENCRITVTTTITYQDKSGTVVAAGESSYINTVHEYRTESTLLGKDCEDGVKVTQTCQDCGFVSQYTSHGHSQIHTRYDLSQYGLCGGELVTDSCACGKNGGYYTNNEKCQWIPDKKTPAERCAVCGITRTQTRSAVEILDTCWEKTPVTITYSKDNESLLEVSCFTTDEIHRYVHTMTLFGTSCEDGYQLQQKCMDCGKTGQWESYDEDHGTYAVSRKWLSQGALCGDVELVNYSCGCGQITSQNIQWRGGECIFNNSSYLGEGKGYISVCSQCGASKNWTEEEQEVEGTCFVENIEHATFSRNGTELFHCDLKQLYQRHNNMVSFQLFGTTCQDGFQVTHTCSDCGRVSTKTVTQVDGCTYWGTTGREILHDGEGICGPVEKQTSSCPCGNLQQIYINDQCHWENGYWDGDTYIKVCSTCGVQCLEEESSVEDPKNCERIRQHRYTYRKGDTELLNTKISYSEQMHEFTAEFELLGETCEDGYYVTQTCVRCGDVQKEDGITFGHGLYITEHYNLQTYGLCGGDLKIQRCACGQQIDWNTEADSCSWYNTGETDETIGLEWEYCAKCDTYRILGNTGASVKDSCDWRGTLYAVLKRNGEILLDLRKPIAQKNHQYVMENVVLYDADQGCDGGYRATMQCRFCDEYREISGHGHDLYGVETLYLRDLYAKACDGYISLEKCPCGSNTRLFKYACNSFWNTSTSTYEGSDGYTHTLNVQTCTECEVVWTEDYYLEPVSNSCAVIRNSIHTLSYDGQVLKSWTTRNQEYQHEMQTCYTLLNGSTSCEDGLKATETCQFCDYENISYLVGGSDIHNNYNLDAEDSVDLTDYGSVCGGQLAHYTCACGKNQRYDFSKETLCDIDRVEIDNWVPGSIDAWQHTSEGYNHTDSVSYMLTCAVTDKDCDLVIRMSEYWLEKDCAAVEYQTWQLGYDKTTGTCQYEFTIETGDRHAYHLYQDHQNSMPLPDDGKLVTVTQECPKCGSSYAVKTYYNLSGSEVKTEEIAVNTLNNGENRQLARVYEYDVLYKGYRYQTRDRYEFIYADGSDYWYQYVYEYDFSKGCYRTDTYTNSNGGYSYWSGERHNEIGITENLNDPTCSQFGKYRNVWTCAVCDEYYVVHEHDIEPIAHSWYWNQNKQFYECSFCGLENINGASGEIVIEDLTDSYGKGTNYVVGYWNRGNVEALRYVSVVLKDVQEGENDELVLTDIPFTDWSRTDDGITAVVFSQEAVKASAQKAVADAGYTGSYAIRFSFVPKHAADTLDYAITFDNLNA